MEIDLGTVKGQLSRARKLFKSIFEEDNDILKLF